MASLDAVTRFPLIKIGFGTQLKENACLKVGVFGAESLGLSLALWALGALQEWVLDSACLFVLLSFPLSLWNTDGTSAWGQEAR